MSSLGNFLYTIVNFTYCGEFPILWWISHTVVNFTYCGKYVMNFTYYGEFPILWWIWHTMMSMWWISNTMVNFPYCGEFHILWWISLTVMSMWWISHTVVNFTFVTLKSCDETKLYWKSTILTWCFMWYWLYIINLIFRVFKTKAYYFLVSD